ncbi:hypothetical protein LTR47_001293 [Exophiala xenobiotica]|nr:hypothetical protein LTR47_001293 [Exophiala xenobiotica]KAK5243519.1 hypothetical protein LTS06_010739 [Exophiala xenobiotica]KAK5257641.1 hypothetical protein LTR40_009493 [Exophiala xenobiotica]KAK5355952.1 hypothetical protein LTR61_001625 [Exophiala xenobiotica]KAK5368545.1 hypothetical protein LTS03_008016 [Exophiala xenobiotica]
MAHRVLKYDTHNKLFGHELRLRRNVHVLTLEPHQPEFTYHQLPLFFKGACQQQVRTYASKFWGTVFNPDDEWIDGEWQIYTNHVQGDGDEKSDLLYHIPRWEGKKSLSYILPRCHSVTQERIPKYEPIPVTTQEKEAALEDIRLPGTAGLARTTSTGSSLGSTG